MIMNNYDYNYVVAYKNRCGFFDFRYEEESLDDLLQRAIDRKYKEINRWKELLSKRYESCWVEYLERAEQDIPMVMTWEDYQEHEKRILLSDDLQEITEEQYNDALDVLPPLKWCQKNGVEMFCICEMYTGSYTTQYAKAGGKYYTKMVDVLDDSTWIDKILFSNMEKNNS